LDTQNHHKVIRSIGVETDDRVLIDQNEKAGQPDATHRGSCNSQDDLVPAWPKGQYTLVLKAPADIFS
jgi:hypothetical protein